VTATATETVRTGTVLRHTIKKDRPAPLTRTAPRRNAAGHDLGTVDLEPTVFGLEPNRAVLHQVVTAQLAAARAGTQSTLTRSEVRGGGAKPFRQKGTGRARQGSSRSPSMSGGGVALGPKPRSYAQHTPKKMVRLALLSALSDRAEMGRVTVVDDWKITAPKTKDAATILRKLKLTGSVLIVLAHDELDVERSFANLPEAQTTTFGELSAHDVLRSDWLLFSDRTLPASPSDFSGTHVVEEREATETPVPAKAASAAKAAKAGATDKAEASVKAEGGDEAIEVEVGEAAEGAEAAPAKPRKRATKRAKAVAVAEPEADAETEAETDGAREESDADA
jgi:large subunit ribosomal protein L4